MLKLMLFRTKAIVSLLFLVFLLALAVPLNAATLNNTAVQTDDWVYNNNKAPDSANTTNQPSSFIKSRQPTTPPPGYTPPASTKQTQTAPDVNVPVSGKSDSRDMVIDIIKAVFSVLAIIFIFVLAYGIVQFINNRKIIILRRRAEIKIIISLAALLLIFSLFGIVTFTVKTTNDSLRGDIGASSGSLTQSTGSGKPNIGLNYASNLGLSASDSVSKSVSSPSLGAPLMESENIGLAVGGTKDVGNFRENIKNDYTPLPTDITYEGLFYDYYFETGQAEECSKLFCPSYSAAVSPDPFSNEMEYYLSVGLNSGIKESDFVRKKLNLLVVMDISGSMGSAFNKYYYDSAGNRIMREDDRDGSKSKMQIADEAVVAMLDHLNPDDRFGMVLFDDSGYLAKPFNLVSETDIDATKEHILDIEDRGGTNMAAGMRLGTAQFDEFLNSDKDVYENRIIFLTDAMPNRDITSKTGLLGMTETNAKNGIYTSFIGIGVDFNTELIEAITKIRGGNYYSVHSSKEFKTRMADEFDYMVTPLVFDLELALDAEGYEIEKVFGSPEADLATGEIMKVNTLFPSKSSGGETKGGIILIKLKKLRDNAVLTLRTSYMDRMGKTDGDKQTVVVPQDIYFANSGIEKAVVLTRYAGMVKNWIVDTRKYKNSPVPRPLPIDYYVNREKGIQIIEMPDYDFLGQWERRSLPLTVSSHYQELFKDFILYMNTKIARIGDNEMNQEIEILNKLVGNPVAVEDDDEMVGNDRDEHGCIGSAGYTWCASKNKCLRTWEEDCPLLSPASFTADQCENQGGRVVNITGGVGCTSQEQNIGSVTGFISEHICCK